jgi:hypothetical protein
MTQTCVICRRAHKDSYACQSCIGRLCADLRAVPELVDELEVTRCRLDNLGADPGKSSETRMVWSEAASEALFVLGDTIGTWARDLWETHGVGPLVVSPDPASLSRFMLRWPSHLAAHPAIEELDDEIRAAVKNARQAIDRRADTRVFLGRCDLNDPENLECSRELYATRSQEQVTCKACGAEWSVAERRAWLLGGVEDEVMTGPVLAALVTRLGVPITVGQIQGLARKGVLRAATMDTHRKRSYRVGDVLDVFMNATAASA